VETFAADLKTELRRDRAKVPAGRYVVVKVEDQGSGIPPDKIGKIFEPFFTTKRAGEGTGLGLSTVYGIVKQSGGFVFVDSALGTGTVFTLYFPAHDGPVDSAASAAAVSRPAAMPALAEAARLAAPRRRAAAAGMALAEAPESAAYAAAQGGGQGSGLVAGQGAFLASAVAVPLQGGGFAAASRPTAPAIPAGVAPQAARGEESEGVVLLVEDEAPVRAFASRALRMRGYTVIEAESAEEALATLEDPALKVDLFVTDVIMPGLDGPSWVKKAREARPGVKVIFVSGYAEDSFGEDKARIPNSVFLPKPFSLNELTATVQDQLH
jgi:two-component system cell cycle sensor histidine kinase/response regulator CckA